MLRSKLLLFILSGALIFASCSDSGTGSGNGDGDGDGNGNGNGEETVEPTASVNNPSDGATLEGEITFSVDGDSENGFDELRILVGDEQVETIDNPSMPYEYALATYEYNNGDHDLTAELDPSDEDTTVEASVSTTFENYLVTLNTDGYINYLKEYNDAAYMFIADPQGNVLREMELTAQSDGTFKLLPPSSFDEDAPEHYSITIGTKDTDFEGNPTFDLSTDIGLESWSQVYKYGSVYDSDTKELTVKMGNFQNGPDYAEFTWGDGRWTSYDNITEDSLMSTFEFEKGYDDLFATSLSYSSDYTPVYKWQENISDLSDPATITYDVQNDFTKMTSTDVDIPSGLGVFYYIYHMSIEQNSWDAGSFYLPVFYGKMLGGYHDANSNDSELGMYIPHYSNHQFRTRILAYDESDNSTYYVQRTTGDLPNEFTPLDAEMEISKRSLDDLQLSMSGNADYGIVEVTNSGDMYSHTWTLRIPDSLESYVFPKIADSLDQSVSNYDRSKFTFDSVEMYDYEAFAGYTDYLDQNYSSSQDDWWGSYNHKNRNLSSSSQKMRPVEPSVRRATDAQRNQIINGTKYLKRGDRTKVPFRN